MLKKLLMLAAMSAVTISSQASAASFYYSYMGITDSNTAGTFTVDGTPGDYSLTAFLGTVGVVNSYYSLADVGIGYDSPDRIYLGGLLNGLDTVYVGTKDFVEFGDFMPGGGSFTGSFGYTFPMQPFIYVKVAITEIGIAASVPEPNAWAMMLLGTGLTGLMLRRRQQISVRVKIS